MYTKLTERRLEMLQQCSKFGGKSLVQAHNEAVELYISLFLREDVREVLARSGLTLRAWLKKLVDERLAESAVKGS